VEPDLSDTPDIAKKEASQDRKEALSDSGADRPDAMEIDDQPKQGASSKRKSPSETISEEVPEFLPHLPDPHTYKFTPVCSFCSVCL
jgi:hypothetical protein